MPFAMPWVEIPAMPRCFLCLAAIAGLVLCTSLPPGEKDVVRITAKGRSFDFSVVDKLVGTYHCETDLPQPHFHPLFAYSGKPLTRAYPMMKDVPGETKDHPHHRGVWFCHGDVIPEGIEFTKRK